MNFENLMIWFDSEDECDERPFLIACRDREVKSEERWVVSSLSYEEAKQLCEFLKGCLK
mgnify:CR=1 FL=1